MGSRLGGHVVERRTVVARPVDLLIVERVDHKSHVLLEHRSRVGRVLTEGGEGVLVEVAPTEDEVDPAF